ncbi:MAG TPA: hypothetical protein VMT23_04105 [Candidatus Binatia bacterium]|nr:hypothetical protein [Candidatus Binatia bacterium]
MAHAYAEAPASLPFIESSQFVPGLVIEYGVWANKHNQYGDFSNDKNRFTSKLHDSWLIAASVVRVLEVGYETEFEVYESDSDRRVLMSLGGVILHRPKPSGLSQGHHSTHPIEEGFATPLSAVTMDVPEELAGTLNAARGANMQNPQAIPGRLLIPARNVVKHTLRVVYNPSEQD